MTNNDFKDIILNRRSIRSYKRDFEVSDETIKAIFDMALRAPSSKNLQPWLFKIIKSQSAKNTYSSLFKWNRSQYETSSFMVIVFVEKTHASKADTIYDMQVEKGTMTDEVRTQQLLNLKNNMPDAITQGKTTFLDAGLAAMSLMLTARSYGLDTCPIGGFDRSNAPVLFNLPDHEAVMSISFGKKDDEGYNTLRLPFENVAEII